MNIPQENGKYVCPLPNFDECMGEKCKLFLPEQIVKDIEQQIKSTTKSSEDYTIIQCRIWSSFTLATIGFKTILNMIEE